MSVDMNSDDSDDNMYGSDEDNNYDNYYYDNADDVEYIDKSHFKDDPEHFEFELLKVEDVERLLNENVEALCNELSVSIIYYQYHTLILQCLSLLASLYMTQNHGW